MSDAPAVSIEALVKRYGTRTAVNGIDLLADRGSVTALLGPNGAGKTTTIEICEGFRSADGGSVRVLGRDPSIDGATLRTRVGVMLQSGGVYATARAREMLEHVARMYAHPQSPTVLLEQLGLQGLGRTPYRRMSGGEQRRLAFALALVGRPELGFLDEPTAGMDPAARRAVWDVVAGLRRDGVSVMLTTHLMDEVEYLADHVVIIDEGRVVAAGTPTQLTSGDSHQAVAFRGSPGLDLSGMLTALPEGCTAHESPPGTYLVDHPDGISPAMLATITAWCAQHAVVLQGLSLGARTLEDVFLDLTGRELRT